MQRRKPILCKSNIYIYSLVRLLSFSINSHCGAAAPSKTAHRLNRFQSSSSSRHFDKRPRYNIIKYTYERVLTIFVGQRMCSLRQCSPTQNIQKSHRMVVRWIHRVLMYLYVCVCICRRCRIVHSPWHCNRLNLCDCAWTVVMSRTHSVHFPGFCSHFVHFVLSSLLVIFSSVLVVFSHFVIVFTTSFVISPRERQWAMPFFFRRDEMI